MHRNILTVGRLHRWNYPCRSSSCRWLTADVGRRISASKRNQSSSSSSPSVSSNKEKITSNAAVTADESHLNWKERREAPLWIQRMAPTKGGKIGDLKSYEIAALLAAAAVFFYGCWVEPPKPAQETAAEDSSGRN